MNTIPFALWTLAAMNGVSDSGPPKTGDLPLATFAGGCFWGLELAFQRQSGVVDTRVGYANGVTPNPTYESVCSGKTGYAEAVQLTYNPQEVNSVSWSISEKQRLINEHRTGKRNISLL